MCPFPEPEWPAGRLAFPLVESRRPLRSRRRSRGQAWALEGLRSLKIELLPNDEPLKFQSLGTDPLLDIRLIDERRIELLAWGVLLLVLSIGLTLLRRPVADRSQVCRSGRDRSHRIAVAVGRISSLGRDVGLRALRSACC